MTGEDKTTAIDNDIVAFCKTYDESDGISAIVDIGTGSGCIAITLKKLLPDMEVIATDVSEDALEIARINSEYHKTDIDFRIGANLDPVADLTEPFIVISNPPYIPEGRDLDDDVKNYEPTGALFGGVNGTDVIQELLDQSSKNPFCKKIVLELEKNQCPE